jgi:YhcG PDDEXK nuclease domain
VGQLNFYLSAVDAQVKATDDKSTIGLLLCKKQNRLVAQYAVNDVHKPIGIAEFDLLRDLPAPLAENLPSIEEIEAELANETLPEDEE